MRRVALHTCCGPCLIEPLDALRREADITVVYFNPNIHPVEEYEMRLSTMLSYASEQEVEAIVLEYAPKRWLKEVGPIGTDKVARCRACYRLRLGRVASWAAEKGFDALATTLTVSPYQDAEALKEEGQRAGKECGVEYLALDFRERYPEATRRSRELGMYRQNYCGCLLSDIEARDERAARREARRAQRG